MRTQVDKTLDAMERERNEMAERDYREHLRRDRFRRWRNWATRIEDDDE